MSTHTPISNTFAIRQSMVHEFNMDTIIKQKVHFMLGDTNTMLMSRNAQEKLVNTTWCYSLPPLK